MLKGMIIIGVEDSKHIIVGVPDDRVAMTIDTILRAARQNVKPALVLDPPEPELYELGGKRLVVAAVPLSRGPVYQSGGVFWVRRGTYTVPLDAAELLEVMGDKGLVEPLSIGAHVVSRAQLANGENVLVVGAGPIGLAVTQFALLGQRIFYAR